MLHYDRIDVSENMDMIKTSYQKSVTFATTDMFR